MVIIIISTWAVVITNATGQNRPLIALMAAVNPRLRDDQSRPHHCVRVKQGALSGVEGTLVEQLDDDRVLIAFGADADNVNHGARGVYIAIGAAAVELLERTTPV
jgi:hypothetical protein